MQIENALTAHPAVRDLGIGAYLGVPIATADGHALGTVCVTEPGPRAWTAHDVLVLQGVAAAAAGQGGTATDANARTPPPIHPSGWLREEYVTATKGMRI